MFFLDVLQNELPNLKEINTKDILNMKKYAYIKARKTVDHTTGYSPQTFIAQGFHCTSPLLLPDILQGPQILRTVTQAPYRPLLPAQAPIGMK